MSWSALAWAAKYPADSAAEKLMLLAYAECHNDESGLAYPSVDWLCEFSSLNRKTVISAVGKLVEAGLLVDTGKKTGRTRQIPVYSVTVPKTGPLEGSKSPKNGTVRGQKESQKRDTEPYISSNEDIEGFPKEDWEAFKRMRRSIKKPLTPEAERMAIDKLKALAAKGEDMGAVLRQSVFHCWQGLFGVKVDDVPSADAGTYQPGKVKPQKKGVVSWD